MCALADSVGNGSDFQTEDMMKWILLPQRRKHRETTLFVCLAFTMCTLLTSMFKSVYF